MRTGGILAGAAAWMCIAVLSAGAEEARPWPESLCVDFLNREHQSLSVAIGRLHGVEAAMDFAVIDSAGRQIAVFYPDEIRPERFWSSPISAEPFGRVLVGQTVLRMRLHPEESARLRKEGRLLKIQLDRARRAEAIVRLREELADIDEEINDHKVTGVRLARNRAALEQEIAEQRIAIEPKVAALDRDMNPIMREWNEKEVERKDLLDRRDSLLKRSSPPQNELDRLNRDLGTLERQIVQIQNRFRELWERKQALLDSIGGRTQDRLEETLAEEADNLASIADLEVRRRVLADEIEVAERALKADNVGD